MRKQRVDWTCEERVWWGMGEQMIKVLADPARVQAIRDAMTTWHAKLTKEHP
jgi:hypothetical protein